MNKTYCPMNQNCLATNPIYEATINANLPNNQEKKYIGLCDSTLKKRFANHKSSFNHKRYKNSTSLSVELWKIKEENGTPTVTWQIVRKANAYTPKSKHRLLCLNEKYKIANYPVGKNLLNKCTEMNITASKYAIYRRNSYAIYRRIVKVQQPKYSSELRHVLNYRNFLPPKRVVFEK